MPCRIESDDRLRNVITSVSYISHYFPQSKIIVKEVDNESVFASNVVPVIKNIFGKLPDNLTHIFEKSDNQFFHKTKILNDLLVESNTEVVYNYDVDVVYPTTSYATAYEMISSGVFDAVYPYGCGVYQYAVDYSVLSFESFIESGFDLRVLNSTSRLHHRRMES